RCRAPFLSRRKRFFVFAPASLGTRRSDSSTVMTAGCSWRSASMAWRARNSSRKLIDSSACGADIARREAFDPPERPRELACGREAGRQGDLEHRARSLAQELSRPRDAKREVVLVDAAAE